MDKQSKLDKLNKMLELIQNDTLTPKVIEQFLVTILSVIKQSKDSFEKLSSENLKQIDLILTQIKKNYENSINTLDSKSNAVVEQIEAKLATVNDTLAKVKKIKAIPGKDGYTPKKGVDYFDGENGKPGDNGSPDTAEQIANKLETLKDDARLDASAIKNLPEFIDSRPNGGGWRNLFQLHDVDSSDNTTGYVLTRKADGTFNFQAGGGGGGSGIAIGDTITSATAGSVLFAGAAGVLSQDNANFFWDDTNNRLGIGTTSPAAPLDIKGVTSTATVGSELITLAADRDFSSNTGNWTGANWTIGSGVATAGAGASGFTLALSALSAAPVVGAYYLFSYTITWISNANAKNLDTSLGGTVNDFSNSISANTTGTTTVTGIIKAVNTTSPLKITAYQFEGTIDNVSLKRVTNAEAVQIWKNSDGSIGNEIRSGGNGFLNTFVGLNSGVVNTRFSNTVFGTNALSSNVTGDGNHAFGSSSLLRMVSGSRNMAFGSQAIQGNVGGSDNIGIGDSVMRFGSYSFNKNIGIGTYAFKSLAVGDGNVGIGYSAGYSSNTTTDYANNIFLGYQAANNITNGANNNIIIGYDIDLPTAGGSNQMSIGNLIYATGLGATGTTVSTGNIGIGVILPGAKLHSLATTEQLRLGYNSTNYLSTTVGSTGSTTFALTGTTPTFTFSQKINADGDLKIGTSSTIGYVWTATDTLGNGSWQAGGGGGGTPGGANTEIQFNDSGSFGGDSYFTWDKTGNILNLGVEAGSGTIHGVSATTANTTGGSLSFVTGNGLGSGDGGLFEIIGGNGGSTGNGAEVRLTGGTGGATLGNGGGIKISGADAQTGTGGNGGGILFEIGSADGGGTNGYYGFTNLGGIIQTLDFNSATGPNTYTFPDLAGTVALLNSTGLGVVTVDNLTVALNTVKGLSGLNFINNVGDLYKFRSFTGSGVDAILDTSLVATSDKTYTLQNASGTLAFLSDITAPTLTSTYIGVGDGSNLLSGSSAFTYASGRITNTATTTQQRLAYNATTDFVDTIVSSNGTTSYAITSSSGTPTFNFNKEMIVDLGTIPYVGQYAHHIKAIDVLFGGTYEIITNFGYNYTTQYITAQSRNPGIIEFDGGTQSFSFRSGNGGYTDIFGYNKLDLRSLSGQPINIKNGSTTNIQVTGAGNIELQDSVKLLTYGSGTHSGTPAYTLQVDASGNIIEGSPSGGSGILRSVNVISTNTSAGATGTTDYVYIVSGTTTLTLPTAVGNTNRYTVKRTDATLTTTIATTSAQTIDGGAGYTLTSQYESIDLISDGSNWLII